MRGRVFGSVMVAVMAVSSVVVGQAAAAPVGTDDTVTVAEAAAALADVASVAGPSALTAASSEGFTAVSAGSVVELPRDPSDGLSFTAADGASIEIGLPGAANADDGVRQASGEVVYADALPDVAVAAQPTPDGGMRALVVIDGPQAPTEFRFPMTLPAGASLVPTGDGGAAVIGVDGTPIVQVAPPWAYDTNGTGVVTSYRIDGSTLIQKIDHVGAAYPVVADPKLSYGWSIYLKYSKQEVKDFKSQGPIVGAAALLAWACAALPAKPLIAVCLVSVAVVGAAIIDTFNKAAAENKCVELKFSYTGDVDGWKRYSC